MANKPIAMHLIRKIYRLHSKGTSKLKMSRRLGISRNTVKKYLRFLDHHNFTPDQIQELSDQKLSALFHAQSVKKPEKAQQLEQYFPHMDKELRRVGVTRLLLWQEYKAKHPEGYMFTQFCYYYRLWKRQSSVVLRFEHKAGDKLFVDFTGKKLYVVDKQTGQLQEMEVFVGVLGSSQLTYVEAVTSQQKEDFIRCTEHALHYYGGVPACITTDNLKAAVTKSNKYEPSLNETFADFADHYDTTILPTRTYKPRDKALVENSVRIVYNRIYATLRDEVFHTLQELNEAIWEALEVHNNLPFQNRPYSRRGLFEQTERSALQPLPTTRYELKRYAYGTVFKNSHIFLNKDKHYYSVPYQYVGRKVKIIYSPTMVQVYYKYEQIAQHERQYVPYQYTTVAEHLPTNHQFVRQWSAQTFLDKAAKVGQQCQDYIQQVLDQRGHPEQAYKSCMGILSLEKKFGAQRLNKACKRALAFEAYTYHTVKNILEKGWDTIEEPTADDKTPVVPIHPNIRGKEYYK